MSARQSPAHARPGLESTCELSSQQCLVTGAPRISTLDGDNMGATYTEQRPPGPAPGYTSANTSPARNRGWGARRGPVVETRGMHLLPQGQEHREQVGAEGHAGRGGLCEHSPASTRVLAAPGRAVCYSGSGASGPPLCSNSPAGNLVRVWVPSTQVAHLPLCSSKPNLKA